MLLLLGCYLYWYGYFITITDRKELYKTNPINTTVYGSYLLFQVFFFWLGK